LHENANFSLVTILWGNVAVNVLLALLSGSVLAGIAAFLFFHSSNHSVCRNRAAGLLHAPCACAYIDARALAAVVSIHSISCSQTHGFLLDAWLGGENIRYIRERELDPEMKGTLKNALKTI